MGCEVTTVAKFAAAPVAIYASSAFVEFVFGNWPWKASCLECVRRRTKTMTAGYDPIILLMIQIKNSLLAGHPSLVVPTSSYREAFLQVLKDQGLVTFKVFKEGESGKKKLQVVPEEGPEVYRRLTSFRSFSRPGRRFYLTTLHLTRFLAKRRTGLIISTSRGLLAIKDAVKRRLGGEVLIEV